MGESVLGKAFGVSAAIHLLVIAAVGHVSEKTLYTPSNYVQSPRFISVDLVDLPPRVAHKMSEAPKVSLPTPTPVHTSVVPSATQHLSQQETVMPRSVNTTRADPRGSQRINVQSEDAGGKLNIGSTSASGDLPDNWGGGKTPVGWVPDPKEGPGQGSGHNPGVGTPEPPRREDITQTPSPSSGSQNQPPKPTVISVRVCAQSGLLPGPNCRETEVRNFTEGGQPGRTCDSCQPPHKSRLADRAEPQLLQDSRLTVPSSIPEGLTLRVEIQYTVTTDGDVTDITILKSSGYKALDNAIISAAPRMKYKTAVQDGGPRSVKRIRTYTINT